jgi:hypothetical protein
VHQLVELAEVILDGLVLVGDDGERLPDGVDGRDDALGAVEDPVRALVVIALRIWLTLSPTRNTRPPKRFSARSD